MHFYVVLHHFGSFYSDFLSLWRFPTFFYAFLSKFGICLVFLDTFFGVLLPFEQLWGDFSGSWEIFRCFLWVLEPFWRGFGCFSYFFHSLYTFLGLWKVLRCYFSVSQYFYRFITKLGDSIAAFEHFSPAFVCFWAILGCFAWFSTFLTVFLGFIRFLPMFWGVFYVFFTVIRIKPGTFLPLV